MQPETRYAKSGDVHVAYQVFGEGPINVVLAPGFVSNVESYWDEPELARFLLRLASFARVAMFDKRGTGMSDRVPELPGMDQRMDDLRAVMQSAGMEKAALLGVSEGGPLTALYAATHPERCSALVLYGSFARFESWFPTEEALAQFLSYVDEAWGTGGSLPFFAPSRGNDPAFQHWWGRFERLGASPSAAQALMRMNSQIDITDIVPTIRVPTLVIHRTEDVTINVEAGRYLAQHIPGARYIELPGKDHLPFVGDNAAEIADAIEEFLTGAPAPITVDRVLSTVLFIDIVGSTERAVSVGDARWRDLLKSFLENARQELDRYRGRLIDTAGDGVFASFDGPARAVRCASAIRERMTKFGIAIRSGLHTGECELAGEKLAGIAVHTGARVAAAADAGEILVSSTVKDLVAGSGLHFADRGRHRLKGLTDELQLYAVDVHVP